MLLTETFWKIIMLKARKVLGVEGTTGKSTVEKLKSDFSRRNVEKRVFCL